MTGSWSGLSSNGEGCARPITNCDSALRDANLDWRIAYMIC
jgi:hypothetical protein